jgi:hypothetical protein
MKKIDFIFYILSLMMAIDGITLADVAELKDMKQSLSEENEWKYPVRRRRDIVIDIIKVDLAIAIHEEADKISQWAESRLIGDVKEWSDAVLHVLKYDWGGYWELAEVKIEKMKGQNISVDGLNEITRKVRKVAA